MGCGGRERPVDAGTRDGILHFGNEAEPKGLDPHLVTGFVEHRVLLALFEGLTTMDNTLNVQPGVAERWDISEDKKVYTFHLREDAKWSNGDPVTAGDFVFAWQRILTKTLGSEYAYMLFCIENAREFYEGQVSDFGEVGCTVIDNRTLEVRLIAPTPYFLPMQIHYTWFPLHRATLEQHGDLLAPTNPWTRAGNMVSNGPFKLARWEPEKIIVAEKSDTYWDRDAVRLNAVHIYPISDRNTEERKFRVGDIHVTQNLPPSKVDTYRKEHADVLDIYPVFGTYFYRFNVDRPPLDNKLVRKALAMAIDKQAICDAILRAGQLPATAFTPPDPKGYAPRAELNYDLQQAKALLAEAGYPGGAGMAPVEILYNTDDVHREVAEAIQAMWKRDLGVNATMINQEWKVYLESTTNQNYSVARSSWYGDFLDPINFLECFQTGGGNNRTGWSSPAYDALLEQARLEPDEDARRELFQQAEAILLDEAPIAPIYTYVHVGLRAPDVRGMEENILTHCNFKYVWLEKAPAAG